jgi:hypothetical protein
MTYYTSRRPPLRVVPVRRRPARSLELLAVVPEDRTAAAIDAAAEAQALIDDLLALAEAGLIVPINDHGQTRYALTDPSPTDRRAA